MEINILRREIEEFFDQPADIRQLPNDSTTLASDLSYGLKCPQVKEPFEIFFNGLTTIQAVRGMAFIIDGLTENGQDISGVNIYWHFFQKWLTPDSPEAVKTVEYIARGTSNIKSAYQSSKTPLFSISRNFTFLQNGSDLTTAVSKLVKRTFQKETGMFGLGRIEEEPPSKFIVARINH